MEMEIREPKNQSEREAIYQLRYRVYVEEKNYPQPFADHKQKRIEEPFDSCSTTIGAFIGNICVGTMRTVPTSKVAIPNRELFPIEDCERMGKGSVVLGTKLIVEPAYRGTYIGIALMKESFRLALEAGVGYCVLEAYDELIPLYERMGFVKRGEKIKEPLFGDVTMMVLDCRDLAHLEKMRSPFTSVLKNYLEKQVAA